MWTSDKLDMRSLELREDNAKPAPVYQPPPVETAVLATDSEVFRVHFEWRESQTAKGRKRIARRLRQKNPAR